MSLNKFTFSDPIKNYLNIGCNTLNTKNLLINDVPVDSANYVYNNTQLAPRGASDTWSEQALPFVSSALIPILGKIFTTYNSTRLAYSTDGGLTFTLCTIAIPVGSIVYKPAYNPVTGMYLILTAIGTTIKSFYSDDGVTWSLLSTFTATILGTSGNLVYFNNYFISVCQTGFIVSLNGVTWTPVNLPNLPHSFAIGLDENNTNILISHGSNTYYTYDGLLWFIAGTYGGRAIVYSLERQEFIMQTSVGSFYRSTNGRDWSLIASTAYGQLNQILWVGNDFNGIPINQYYFQTLDYNNYFTLTYSPTCSTGTFGSIMMNGSKVYLGAGLYSVLYVPQYDRFIYSINDAPKLYYANKTNQTATQSLVTSEILVPHKLILGGVDLLTGNNLKISINGNNYTIALTPA